MIKNPVLKKTSGSVLLVTLIVVLLVTIAVMGTMRGIGHEEVMTRNHQFRLNVVTAASSEVGSQIYDVNSNNYDEDDKIILELLSTRGVTREHELPIGTETTPLKIPQPPHVTLSKVEINGEIVKAVPCPGESIGTTKVLMGTIQARASMADTGIQSSQKQHFIYCW
ncbi:MAG: hypothetical protein AB8B97_03900 [Granulosicoccus sp.]